MGIARLGDLWTTSECLCLPTVTELDATMNVLVDGGYVTTDIRFVGIEPAVCVE
jgi:hypothetical protein